MTRQPISLLPKLISVGISLTTFLLGLQVSWWDAFQLCFMCWKEAPFGPKARYQFCQGKLLTLQKPTRIILPGELQYASQGPQISFYFYCVRYRTQKTTCGSWPSPRGLLGLALICQLESTP